MKELAMQQLQDADVPAHQMKALEIFIGKITGFMTAKTAGVVKTSPRRRTVFFKQIVYCNVF